MDWEGSAVEQVERNLNLLQSWVDQAVRNAAKTGAFLETQAQHVSTMRNNLPPPPSSEDPEVPIVYSGEPGVAINLGMLDDWQPQDSRRIELAHQAVQVMETYTTSSAQNKPHMHAFATPIAVTTESAAAAPLAGGGFGIGGGVGTGGVVGPGGFAGVGVPDPSGGGSRLRRSHRPFLAPVVREGPGWGAAPGPAYPCRSGRGSPVVAWRKAVRPVGRDQVSAGAQ
jgi:hypothetical protein